MILQKCVTFWDYKREREKMNYQEIKRAVELVKAEKLRCIGNGWMVDVIAHILRGLKEA